MTEKCTSIPFLGFSVILSLSGRGSFHGLLFNLIFNHLIFLVKCQKLERTLLTGDHEEIALSAVGGDESGCKLACQLDEQCVGASIGGRGQKCLQFKGGYGIQTTGRGLRGWTSGSNEKRGIVFKFGL